MITIFTTCKNFKGTNRTNQLNAIRSWLSSEFKKEIIIYGPSEGIEQISNHENIIHKRAVPATHKGVPFVSEMFFHTNEIARYPICCFVNADIILTDNFFNKLVEIHKLIQKNYLIVGQRYDLDLAEKIHFNSNWESQFLETYQKYFALHSPAGSDFFVFPKGQYPKSSLPELLVGRPGWDNWMIYDARMKNYYAIDLSYSEKVIHLNHDYHHKPKNLNAQKEENTFNLKHFKQINSSIYTLLACNYLYIDTVLKRNYARGNISRFFAIETNLSTKKNSHRTFLLNIISKFYIIGTNLVTKSTFILIKLFYSKK